MDERLRGGLVHMQNFFREGAYLHVFYRGAIGKRASYRALTNTCLRSIVRLHNERWRCRGKAV